MRALEVVVLDEERDAPLAVLEVREHGARQQLLPQRLPEALDLAAGLRMMRPALDVPDAVALELGLELGGSAPAGVLAALVGQDLARHAVLGNAPRQRLQHQRAALVVRKRETHQVTRVVVQERRHIEPLVLPEQEREQVRLPQLVRLGPLEPMHPRLRLGPHRRPCGHQPLLVQHAPHRARRRSQPKVALQHIADAPAARIRLRTLGDHDRRALRPRTRRRSAHRPTAATLQSRLAPRPIAPHPLRHGRVRHPEPRRHRVRIVAVVHHRPHHRQHHVLRPTLPMLAPRTVPTARPVRLSLAFHLSPPRLPARQANRRTSARTLSSCSSAHVVASTALKARHAERMLL